MKPTHYLTALVPVGRVLATCNETPSAVAAQFKTPPAQYRPKFRYWLPDASVSHASVQEDIRQIAAVGAGGLEFVPFYNYGLGPALTDWSVYGFGTEAFKGVLYTALNASATHNFVFDFALGPNQGAGVPSVVEDVGLAKELVYGNTTIQSGETFAGKIPEPVINFNQITGIMNPPGLWGSNELVAVVAGRIVAETPLADYFYMSVLDETSLVDLTGLADRDNLSWTAPEGDGTWVIFGIYERYTNQRGCVSVSNATTALGNGSWMVDHWSASGAKKVTDFWDQQILSDTGIASLMGQVGEYAWEDSMEMQAALPWTPNLFSQFEELHGYSITKYLPLLFHATNAWNGYIPPYNITYTLGEYRTDGGPYLQDYKTALSQGYVDYIEHFDSWASFREFQYSNQPGYNLPLDMAEAVSHVQIPELESLEFSANINLYRQFTGAAHLAGRNVISTEVGAVLGGAYKVRVPELKTLFDGSFTAGVNTMVIHGYAYGGEYVNTTWPGYTPFQYTYAEMWNFRQPAWQHLDDLMEYSARNSMVMRLGVPKVDIAFYYFEIPYKFGDVIYPGRDMNEHGYTFEYLGPQNLLSDQAVVVDGVLAPDGPAFQAMVIWNQTQITPNASAALVEFARNGLPIYIVGTMPNTTVGATGQQLVSANIQELLEYDVVRVISAESFSASTLAADGVPARAQVNAGSNASSLYTLWTSDVSSHSEYIYLYNQGSDGVFNISFLVSEDLEPYVLDAWSGEQTPLGLFTRTSSAVQTVIDLRSNQTTIIAFMAASGTRAKVHAIDRSSNVGAVYFTSDQTLEVLVSDNSTAWITLSNGTQVVFPEGDMSFPAVATLGGWNLTVETYGPFLNNDSVEANITTVNVGVLDALVPWTEISGIEHHSGVGTYRTGFEISTDNLTAILVDFGPVLHTMKAWVNGQQVSAIDPTNPVADISDLIMTGNNYIEIQVTTSLFNTVKANLDHVLSIGYGPVTPTYYTDAGWEEFGLVGPVELKAFRRIPVLPSQ